MANSPVIQLEMSELHLRVLKGLVDQAISEEPDVLPILQQIKDQLDSSRPATMDVQDAMSEMSSALGNVVQVVEQVALPRLEQLEDKAAEPRDASKLLATAIKEAHDVLDAWHQPVDPMPDPAAPRRRPGRPL